jgi:hypothetical protein
MILKKVESPPIRILRKKRSLGKKDKSTFLDTTSGRRSQGNPRIL